MAGPGWALLGVAFLKLWAILSSYKSVAGLSSDRLGLKKYLPFFVFCLLSLKVQLFVVLLKKHCSKGIFESW